MFPNYCFTKVPNDYGYDLLYMPKNAYNGNCHQSGRFDPRPLRDRGKVRNDECDSQQNLQEHNERLRRLHSLKAPPRAAGRTVEFCLPPMDQQLHKNRANAGCIEADDREYIQKLHQEKLQKHVLQQGVPPVRNLPDLRCATSETCSDFFNILYDNVIDAVHGAVEHMVTKHFAHILSRMDQISSDLTQQETIMKQHNSDVMGKIVDQNEASLNQFKFVAQMLIDNQTLFYRALNNQRQSKKHCKDDLTEASKCYSVDCAQRLLDEYDQREEESETAPKSTCKNCHYKSSRSGTGKGISTTSMPDLHRSALFPLSRTPSCKSSKHFNQRSTTPTLWTPLGTGARGSQATSSSTTGASRKCRCQVNSSATTQAASSVGSRRKVRITGKPWQNLDDERSQK